MQIDPEKVQTQEETGELAPIDEVEGRVEAEMKIIEGSAKERVAHGLPAFRHDRRLARAAGRFSHSMVTERFFAHVSPSGSTLGERARAAGYGGAGLGETIGWGSGSLATPAAIVEQWMNSPPHQAIILNGRFRKVGLGVANGSPDGVAGGATVTADFGA